MHNVLHYSLHQCVCVSFSRLVRYKLHSFDDRAPCDSPQTTQPQQLKNTNTHTTHTQSPHVSFVVVVYSWAHSTHAAPQSYHPSFCVTQRVDPISQSPFARWCGTIGTRPGWICMCDANYSAHSAHSIFHTALTTFANAYIIMCVCVPLLHRASDTRRATSG